MMRFMASTDGLIGFWWRPVDRTEIFILFNIYSNNLPVLGNNNVH